LFFQRDFWILFELYSKNDRISSAIIFCCEASNKKNHKICHAFPDILAESE
jgi:hypothetical protein